MIAKLTERYAVVDYVKYTKEAVKQAKREERERIRKEMIVWANKIPLGDRSTDSYNVAKKMIDECLGDEE